MNVNMHKEHKLSTDYPTSYRASGLQMLNKIALKSNCCKFNMKSFGLQMAGKARSSQQSAIRRCVHSPMHSSSGSVAGSLLSGAQTACAQHA